MGGAVVAVATLLAERYDRYRAAGYDYQGAVRRLAVELGVDVDTVRRVLCRAGRPAPGPSIGRTGRRRGRPA